MSRRAVRLAVSLVLSATVLVIGPLVHDATAFPATELTTHCEEDRWLIEWHTTVVPAHEDDWLAAFEEWESILKPNGDPKLDIRDSGTGWSGHETVLVSEEPLGGPSGFALHDPDDPVVTIGGVDYHAVILLDDDDAMANLAYI